MAAYSLSTIVTRVRGIQSQISLDEIQTASQSGASYQALQENVEGQIKHLVEGIEKDLSNRNLTAADVAIRSRRGYQWLKFLSSTDSLSAHLDALQRINLYLGKKRDRKKHNVSFSLYHQGPLYKIQHSGNQKKIVAQESFLTAPDTILKALIEVALHPTSKEPRSDLRNYTLNQEYRKIRTQLEYLGVPPGYFSVGTVHHLGDSFKRVNQTYFQGRIPRPHLVWSRRLTQRKFGHYQWDTDTVMVSKSLDQEQMPEFVIDFVLYHELLHKKMGATQAKQNRMAHTREFKEAENQFHQVDKARQLLNRITQKSA